MQLGRPIRADALLRRPSGDRRWLWTPSGLAVAELVPLAYRGVYENAEHFPEARDVLRDSGVTA
jgi:hypothetical protein